MRKIGEREIGKKLAALGCTPFEISVLLATYKIPKGKTATYQQIASAIGRPNSYRAVGNALNRNPLAPLIPCHRVVRSDGKIGGFAHGSARKARMLAAENVGGFAHGSARKARMLAAENVGGFAQGAGKKSALLAAEGANIS